MSASTRLAAAPIVALTLSFVTVFAAGQLTYAISAESKTPKEQTPTSSPPPPPPVPVPKEIEGEISGTFDLGEVQPGTTFEGSVLRADIVPNGDGTYRICVTPPKGTAVEGDAWSANGDHWGNGYCRGLKPGEDVKVKVVVKS
jgi:hypothetical protein